MKKSICLTLILFLTGNCIFAQRIPNWKNPEVFAVNKEATRATSIPYPDEQSALKDTYSASPYYQLLDGLWKFKWVPKVSEVPVGFQNENYNISGWTDMKVPGNWEFNGFGIPKYINTGFGFPVNPPNINEDNSPVGAYRKEFTIPQDWDNRRVFLHFEAGTNAMYIWVNGQEVGYTQNSKSPAEFEITKYIRQGKNLLACQVHKYSDGTYLEDQDMWRLGGINRSVYLYSTAQTRIQDFFAHPDLDKNYTNGVFSIDVTLKNYGNEAQNQSLEVKIVNNAGKNVFDKKQSVTIPAGNTTGLTLSGTVSKPQKWTAETPNLYTMLITLKDDKGNVVESTSHKIGFRKIEINDGQVFVNGKKVYFKGVNLHEFNAFTGNVVDEKVMLRNIQLMKELNINAVRTSHYPQAPLWYKLCDEYGLYLVDEANLESHGLGYGPDNVANFPEWKAQHMDRIIRLVERDKNHASVIFWSLGNEASNGKAFFDMYDWAKERDKSRPVQYEQPYNRRNIMESARNTDVIAPMYPAWESMVQYAKMDLKRPFIICEYAHAMGNSMGNFQEYWDLMRSSKNMQGGFIWEWYNHGYPAVDEQGRKYWAYGGDLKGYNKQNDGNFCMDGIISPDQNYIPHTLIVKKVYQDILFEAKDIEKGIITVINDYKFTNLANNNFTYKWVLLENGEPVADGTFTAVVPADSKKDIKLTLPALQPKQGTEYFLQVFAFNNEEKPFIPIGFEVAKEEFAFPSNNYFAGNTYTGTLTVKKEDDKVTVEAGQLKYDFMTSVKEDFFMFFRGGGNILFNVSHAGKRIFNELPRLDFWRAPTDNDFGESVQARLRLWETAGRNTTFEYKGYKEDNGAVVVTYRVKPIGIEAAVDMAYTVNIDGSLTIDAHYKAIGNNLPEMMRFGMVMSLDEQYDDFTWYGRGPGENYIDRNKDAFMGIWNGKVADQPFAYYRPQETGNKTDVRWLTLKNKDGKGIKVTGNQPLSVNASPYKTEDLDPGLSKKQQHPSDLIPQKEVILNVDLFQRGLAGLNSWGAKPLDQYRFRNKEYRYSYTISFDL